MKTPWAVLAMIFCAPAIAAGQLNGRPTDIIRGLVPTPTDTPTVEEQIAPDADPGNTSQAVFQEAVLRIEGAVVAAGLRQGSPVDPAQFFPANAKILYCVANTRGGLSGDSLVHRWRQGRRIIADVNTVIGGSPWQSTSSLKLPPCAAGAWSVELIHNGNLLKTVTFRIQ